MTLTTRERDFALIKANVGFAFTRCQESSCVLVFRYSESLGLLFLILDILLAELPS